MPEAPYTKQTGSFRIRDDLGSQIEIAIISRFIDVTTNRSTRREWSENKKKRYFDPDGREGDFIEGSTNQFAFLDDPDTVFTKLQ